MMKRLAAHFLALWLACAPALAANQAPIQTPTSGPMSAAVFTATYLNPALLAIWSCNWGPTAPANGPGAAPGLFECWADTTTTTAVFKYYDGASWVTIGKLDTVAHTWTPTRQGVDLGTASIANTGTSGHALPFLDGVNTISAAWNMGTPSAIVLTNGTGLPISSGVSGLGTGCATWLATPSSANLRACLTDEVGTGAAYFIGGALGTPASATLTNATGLPLTSGVTGLLPLANVATGTQDTALGYWGSTAASANSIPNCANALIYSTATHLWGCNVSGGTGTVITSGSPASPQFAQFTSSTAITGVAAAVKADQLTPSSTTNPVVPAVQQFHPSAIKADIQCTNSAGTFTIQAGSYGINTATTNAATCGKTGTGALTITFSSAFTSTTTMKCTGNTFNTAQAIIFTPSSATTVNVGISTFGGTPTNESFNMHCTGTQ